MTQTNFESKNVVPSSIAQVGIITKYTLLDYIRSRRFFIMLIITALISVLLTVLVGYYRPAGFLTSELGFYSSWWGTSVTFVIILSAIFFGGDAISGEFQNKTGYFGVPNPIRRSSIYIGKWISSIHCINCHTWCLHSCHIRKRIILLLRCTHINLVSHCCSH